MTKQFNNQRKKKDKFLKKLIKFNLQLKSNKAKPKMLKTMIKQLRKELKRFIEFADLADNAGEARRTLLALQKEYGLLDL